MLQQCFARCEIRMLGRPAELSSKIAPLAAKPRSATGGQIVAKHRLSFMESPLGHFYLWYTRLGDEPVDPKRLRFALGIVVLVVAAMVVLGWL